MRRANDAGGNDSSHARPRRGAVKPVASRFRGAASSDAMGGNADGQDWERVMHTKLAQWRYMHLVALDELASAERAACAEISSLAAVLEANTTRLHAYECKLARARAQRSSEHFSERAAPALDLLQVGLASTAPAHDQVCSALVTALRRLHTPAGAIGEPEKLPAALRSFRDAADAFVVSARKANVPDAMAAAKALTQLEKVAVSMQQDALANAARQVAAAADAMDQERATRATAVLKKEKARESRKARGGASPARYTKRVSS